MSQVSKYPVEKVVADRIFDIFLQTFVEITNKKDADEFISDLLTPTEKIMLAKRLAIAFLLEKGYDYRSIRKIIRVSMGTISLVNISREHGSNGYKKLLAKIMQDESIDEFLENTMSKVLTITGAMPKGGGTYRYLKNELDRKKRGRIF